MSEINAIGISVIIPIYNILYYSLNNKRSAFIFFYKRFDLSLPLPSIKELLKHR